MKIVVTGTRGFPHVQGGVEKHCEKLYPLLVAKGCEVIVFTRQPYVENPVSTYKGVNLIPLDCSNNKYLEAITHTFKCILKAKSLHPDLIHIHAIGPSLLAPVARLLGLRVVITHHGPDYERKKWPWPAKVFLKFCERMGVVFADRIITISDTIAGHISHKYGRKASVIPNGVDIPECVSADGTLKKYGLEKERYILSVGRFVPEKGFDCLIDAFTMAGTKGWKLVIAGGADHEDQYSRNLKDKAKKHDDILLTGFITGSPLGELYSNAGLFVLPSFYEGLPIVLLEAMSYGLSCIASDIPANRNVELAGERFFDPGNSDRMALKIREFVNREWSTKSREEQIALISERYDWGKISESTANVYQQVAGRPS